MPHLLEFPLLWTLKKFEKSTIYYLILWGGWIDKLPVLIISGEQSVQSEKDCFNWGVSDFIRKPFDDTLVKRRVRNVAELSLYRRSLEWIISALLFAGVSVLFGALIEPFATQIFRGTLGDNAIPKMLLLIAGSSVFGFSLLNMLRLLESNGLKLKVIAWIGKHSLQFFALHTFFMWLIAQAVNYPIFNTEGQDPKTLVALSLLIFLISVGLCALYCMISSWKKRRPLKK